MSDFEWDAGKVGVDVVQLFITLSQRDEVVPVISNNEHQYRVQIETGEQDVPRLNPIRVILAINSLLDHSRL